MKHTLEIRKGELAAVFELEQSGRTFKVIRSFVRGFPELSIGYDPKGVERVVDVTSDAYQVFGISTEVVVLGCTLGTLEMRAFDVETLGLALKKTKLRFWKWEDI